MIVLAIILSFILCLALSHQLNCDEYKDCDCEYKSGYFQFECSKAITLELFDNGTLTARCISNMPTLKLPPKPLNITYLTLVDCIGRSYLTRLVQLLPIPEKVSLTGYPTNLRRIDELPAAQKIKSLTITLYEIGPELLAGADDLQELSISRCGIKLRTSFFNSSTDLKKIVLSRNEITAIPHQLFRPLKKVHEIDVSFNNLALLLGNPFQSLRHLRKLNLEGNNLTLLTGNMLVNLVNLEELNLRGNNIHYIPPDALFIHEYFGKLNVIDLSYNNLTLWEQDDTVTLTPFSGIYREPHRLRFLDLRNNKIQRFLHEWMRFPCADVLDLRYNNITQIDLPKLQTIFALDKILNLEDDVDLYTDSGKFNNTVFLKGNLVASDKKLQHLARYYDHIRGNVTLKNVFDLNKLVCIKYVGRKQVYSCELGAEFCPANCTCFVRPWESLFVVDCENRGFHAAPRLNVPQFFDVQINLNENLLARGPQSDDGYVNVIRLYLSDNRIADLKWIPPKIEVLKIGNNKISSLNEAAISDIRSAKNLKYLELHGNPWICNCETFDLIGLLKLLQPSGKVNLDNVFCGNSTVKVIDLNYNEACGVYERLLLTVLFVTLGMTAGIVVALCYKYREEIKIVLSVNDLLVKFGNVGDCTKVKDAFVCYTHEDEQFLLDKFLPPLEGGFNPYVIGLHFRDWMAGEFITDQIARSVEEARRTIIILSPRFLKSKWAITEFRMAHDLAMRGRTKVVVILYEDVDFEEIPDKALKKYITTGSYIRWDDKKFWLKLKSALPGVSDRFFIMSYRHLLAKEESLIPNE